MLDTLEDMGWDVVDNLPADLLENFVNGGSQCRTATVAVAMDARSRGFDPQRLPELIRSVEGVEPEILYLDCSGTELIRRYDETRRRHPLAPDRPAEDGIARERQLTMPLRNGADSVLDTTDLSPAELRDELQRRYGGDTDQPVLTIASFAFARGISRTADLVFDLRFLPNPHWVDELRPLTGADQPVRDYLAAGAVLGRDDGPHRIASHRLDSPLLGRGQKLRDRCIRMYRGAPPLGGRSSRNGGTFAWCRICSECASP